MTVREIQAHLEEMYGPEISPTLTSSVTDAVIEEVRAWQSRPLDSIYPVYLDCIRPIMLTAIAAILAIIPLTRSAFFGPMAVAIVGDLRLATVLPLLFVPALYAARFPVRRDEKPRG